MEEKVVLAVRGSQRLYVKQRGDAYGWIEDAETGVVSKPQAVVSLLARGYWRPPDERIQKGDWVESEHPRGKTTPESTEGSFAPKAGGTLTVSGSGPPKGKPVVLVFGGSFNPPHSGHVGAAADALRLMQEAGYDAQKVIMAPTADRLLEKKLGGGAYPLAERVKLTELEAAGVKGVEVSGGPAEEAATLTGKLRRTQLAEWAQKHYPGASIVNVTGEDQATGTGHEAASGAKFPLLYEGSKGSSHAGYYYLALARPEGSISSTKIRTAIREGKSIAPEIMKQTTVRYLHEMFKRRTTILKQALVQKAAKRAQSILADPLVRSRGGPDALEVSVSGPAGRVGTRVIPLRPQGEERPQYYVIVTAGDERVCPVCDYLSTVGEFPLSVALDMIDDFLDAVDDGVLLSKLQDISPFVTIADVEGATVDDLIEMGVVAPAFHPNCRCGIAFVD